jgi:hypothetical protein
MQTRHQIVSFGCAEGDDDETVEENSCRAPCASARKQAHCCESPREAAWRAHRVRTCELATEYCLGLASALAKAGRDAEAATDRLIASRAADQAMLAMLRPRALQDLH